MDKASAYEAGDCGFESRRRLLFTEASVALAGIDDTTSAYAHKTPKFQKISALVVLTASLS
uniref:Uncharacterized protein n=1 Tax=Peronospora matthiolae TaxID=2874970 RepID=A0AAV1UI33_9STRA